MLSSNVTVAKSCSSPLKPSYSSVPNKHPPPPPPLPHPLLVFIRKNDPSFINFSFFHGQCLSAENIYICAFYISKTVLKKKKKYYKYIV